MPQNSIDWSSRVFLCDRKTITDLLLSFFCSYLANNSNKEAAAALIQQARLRICSAAREIGTENTHPQGIFLIRPSASQQNKLVSWTGSCLVGDFFSLPSFLLLWCSCVSGPAVEELKQGVVQVSR